jgi:hypothetical protein
MLHDYSPVCPRYYSKSVLHYQSYRRHGQTSAGFIKHRRGKSFTLLQASTLSLVLVCKFCLNLFTFSVLNFLLCTTVFYTLGAEIGS